MTDDAISPADLERELLGGERQYNRREVAERSGVPVERANEFWRALGFADVADDVEAFTDRDVWALDTVSELGKQGWLDDESQIAMTRALGQSLARLADWQIASIGSMVDPDAAVEESMARARDLVPIVEQLIGFVWRRHLAAAAGRALASSSEFATSQVTVGFADMVGFTSLTRSIDEAGLARLVEHFESKASDLIASGHGRVVKTVGDEVMFVADTPATAAELGMTLSEWVESDRELPELRVGLACGTVVSRMGDLYGEPVNLAARLTSIARPGSVLVDKSMHAALKDDDRWLLRHMSSRPVRGYSSIQPYRLRRVANSPKTP